MKLTLSAAFCAGISLLLISCEKKAAGEPGEAVKTDSGAKNAAAGTSTVSQKEALQSFGASLKELNEWRMQKEADSKDDRTYFLKVMVELARKMRAVPTDGLPEDLKEAYNGWVAANDKGAELTSKMVFPEKEEEEEVKAWMDKTRADPAFNEFIKAGAAAVAKMRTLTRKYEIEGAGF